MLSTAYVAERLKLALDHLRWTNDRRQIIFVWTRKMWMTVWHTTGMIFVLNQTKDIQFATIWRRLGNGLGCYWVPQMVTSVPEPDWRLQQDNTPIHTARSTKAYIQEHGINLFENWTAKSPDMNIIEIAWGLLAREVLNSNRHELTDAINSAWGNISQDQIHSNSCSVWWKKANKQNIEKKNLLWIKLVSHKIFMCVQKKHMSV